MHHCGEALYTARLFRQLCYMRSFLEYKIVNDRWKYDEQSRENEKDVKAQLKKKSLRPKFSCMPMPTLSSSSQICRTPLYIPCRLERLLD